MDSAADCQDPVTFVLAFTNKQFVSDAPLTRVMFVAALVVTLILSSGATEPAWALILANLGFFFVAAMMCHTQLANDRPSTTHLAQYYLWIAVGGALGSSFNVLIAPLLFTSVVEYPLAIVLACMLQRVKRRGSDRKYLDVIYPLGLYVFTVTLAMLVPYLRVGSSTIQLLIFPGIPLIIINHFFRERPMRFALGLCAVMLASTYFSGDTGRTLHVARNFFGTIRVTIDPMGRVNSLYLQNCASGSVSLIEGDARLNLQNAPEGYYGLIVLDAFSSDAIPVHLITQQALDLYLSKLAVGGMLAFHVSSRSLNLNPILADLAESRNLICIAFNDSKPSSLEGKDPSQWVVMARSAPEISYLSINSQWQRLTGRKGTRPWSDDFSNIVRAIKW